MIKAVKRIYLRRKMSRAIGNVLGRVKPSETKASAYMAMCKNLEKDKTLNLILDSVYDGASNKLLASNKAFLTNEEDAYWRGHLAGVTLLRQMMSQGAKAGEYIDIINQ